MKNLQKKYQTIYLKWAIAYLKSRIWEVHKLNVGTYYQAIQFLVEYEQDLEKAQTWKESKLEDLCSSWCMGL